MERKVTSSHSEVRISNSESAISVFTVSQAMSNVDLFRMHNDMQRSKYSFLLCVCLH